MRCFVLCAVVFASAFGQSDAFGNLVISQYYAHEVGLTNNKWIEIFNAGTDPFDLTTIKVGVWSNGNAEGYKSNIATGAVISLSGSLPSGGVFTLARVATAAPAYALPASATSDSLSFDGNDSVAIYTGATFSTSNILDAIGFTDTGNQGADKSFVRTSLAAGYDLASGSNATQFSTWQQFSLGDVDNALAGSNQRLGFTTLSVVPEPSAFVLGGLVCGVLGLRYARQRLADGKPAP